MQGDIQVMEKSIAILKQELDTFKDTVSKEMSKWHNTNLEIEHNLKKYKAVK